MNIDYCKTQFNNALNTLEKTLTTTKSIEEYQQALTNISKSLKYGIECLEEIK